MNPTRLIKWICRRIARFASGNRATTEQAIFFEPEDIPRLVEVWKCTAGMPGTDWDRYRHSHMRLPEWFQHGLNPHSNEYLAQQHALWKLITATSQDYDPNEHELEFGWDSVDPVRRPGFYQRRDSQAITSASDHFIATGMLLKHCGLQANDRALEYGAGFGHTALALARMGVLTDTVDISQKFCSFVQQQADFFAVPLEAFNGPFGFNPRPKEKYKLIWFFESFHHCLDFHRVVPKLREMITNDGKIILSGEPVVKEPCPALPYPWGIRLHSEVAVIMRQTKWFELGFQENFLLEIFKDSKMQCTQVSCESSIYGKLWVCQSST